MPGLSHVCTETDSALLESGRPQRLMAANISQYYLSPWIIEALTLPSLGMPIEAFTLILDGSPTPEKSSEVWKVVQRDAAWQAAFEEAQAIDKSKPIPDYWIENQSSSVLHCARIS